MKSARAETLAAVDLGSNSFHLLIARRDAHGVHPAARVKQPVQLGAGLNAAGELTQEYQRRALACLRDFGDQLDGIRRAHVRAVGTNTFRAAQNRATFIKEFEAALGHPIRVISGEEEARLIYLGATFALPQNETPRLVVDIGGGSSELVIGKGAHTTLLDSVNLGCVSCTQKFFPKGTIHEKNLAAAIRAARDALQPLAAKYREATWLETFGASGTIRALNKLARELGGDDNLNPTGMRAIQDWLLARGHAEKLNLVSRARQPVLAGGFAILSAMFDAIEIEKIQVAEGALREGVLLELHRALCGDD